MNNVRRKNIQEAIKMLEDAKDILQECLEEEEEYRDNMPENLQGSEKYDKADEAVSNLELAIDTIDDVISYADDSTV